MESLIEKKKSIKSIQLTLTTVELLGEAQCSLGFFSDFLGGSNIYTIFPKVLGRLPLHAHEI